MPDFKMMERALHDTLSALGKDALNKIVLIGGWLPYIYSNFYWKLPALDFPQTTDIDLGVLETGAARFGETVYDRLKRAGLALERVYDEEEFPIQFVYRKAGEAVKVEFITSFYTSDDTRKRFLGKELDWNRIESVEIVLEKPVGVVATIKGENFAINIPRPEAFFFHKGIIFATRSSEDKKWKDLYTLFWGLRFCPSKEELVKGILGFRDAEGFELFRENLLEALSGPTKEGYRKLRPLLGWMPADQIPTALQETFGDLIKALK